LPIDPVLLQLLTKHFPGFFKEYLEFRTVFETSQVNTLQLESYSAYSVTGKLARLLNKVVE
jgi:hypothetical protein